MRKRQASRESPPYSDGTTVWFQADRRRWDVGEPDFRHVLNDDGTCKLSAEVHGERIIDAYYPGPLADWHNKMDPTFDAMDIENHDMFYFITKSASDPSWRESAR
jgi:hypothetical protein